MEKIVFGFVYGIILYSFYDKKDNGKNQTLVRSHEYNISTSNL